MNKQFMSYIRNSGLGGTTSLRININRCYITRVFEVSTKVWPDGKGVFHEISPDRSRRNSSCKADVRIVIKSDPDYANEIW